MKDLGDISYFLGINFERIDNIISMDQSQYLKNVLERFGMESCKPRSTPCDTKPSTYYCDDETIINESCTCREFNLCFNVYQT